MSKSLFGSIRDKISRKPSTSGDPSAGEERQPRSTTRQPATMGNNPFSDKNAAGDLPPPPPYTPAAAQDNNLPGSGLTVNYRPASRSPAPSMASITNDDDKYAFLSTFDTIFLIDDSGSMAGSSWFEVRDALQAITPICTSHDKDGIDIYFLNHRSNQTNPNPGGKADGGYYNIRNPERVKEIFTTVRPGRATPTGTRLNHILKPYISELARAKNMENVKPVNIIIITDGAATDDPEGIIIHHAKKLDSLEAAPHQVGIQFFQVGKDEQARVALAELDDGLVDQGVRDMVDTVSWDDKTPSRQMSLTADNILKVVLGAVVRRLDRKQASGNSRSRT